MNESFLIHRFCSLNKRGIFTPSEKEQLAAAIATLNEINSHYAKFAIGQAKKTLDAAKSAYIKDPSSTNRKALDDLRINERQLARENTEQRRLVGLALSNQATKLLIPLLPPIMRRAANYFAWLAIEEEFLERKRFEEYETNYSPSPLVEQLRRAAIGQRHFAAALIEPNVRLYNIPSQINGFEWSPDAMEIEGPIWECDTLDPLCFKKRDAWRNMGQLGNDLFFPVLNGPGPDPDGNARGIGVKKYSADAVDQPSPAGAT